MSVLTLCRRAVKFSGGGTHYIDEEDREYTLCRFKVLTGDSPVSLVDGGKVATVNCEKCQTLLLDAATTGDVRIARVKNIKSASALITGEITPVTGEITPVANRKEFAVEVYSGGPVEWYDTFASALECATDRLAPIGSVMYRETVNGQPVYHKFSSGELLEIISESDKITMCAVSEDSRYHYSSVTIYTRGGYEETHCRSNKSPANYTQHSSLRAKEEAELEKAELGAKFGMA
jgi:hypothetical protein